MVDPNDKTWAEIKAHLESRLSDAVSALKRRDLSHDESQWLRGRISEIEALLDLPTQQIGVPHTKPIPY